MGTHLSSHSRIMMLKICIVLLVAAVVVSEAELHKNKAKHSAVRKARSNAKRAVCSVEQYTCKDGTCIEDDWVCDTELDCADGSDELNCATDCSGPHQLKCDNGLCITKEFLCDGDDDCGDLTDEKDCHKIECPPREVQCDNFLCIENAWVCDGENDCRDNWDEGNCTGACQAGQYRCADGSRCIDSRWKCDGDDDCDDNSDELNCVCDPATEWKCTNGRCIDIDWRCDKDNDCGDASDEQNCPTYHPSLCSDMMTIRDCALMNETSHPSAKTSSTDTNIAGSTAECVWWTHTRLMLEAFGNYSFSHFVTLCTLP